MSKDRLKIRQRLNQTIDTVERSVREPRSIGTMIRSALIELWRSHGGGFYGLGYVVTFVVLEVRTVTGELIDTVAGDASVVAAIAEWVFRFGVDTLLNVIYSIIWPVWILQWLEGWGVLLLGIGFFVFDDLLRPIVERMIPELVAEAPDDASDTQQPQPNKPE